MYTLVGGTSSNFQYPGSPCEIFFSPMGSKGFVKMSGQKDLKSMKKEVNLIEN